MKEQRKEKFISFNAASERLGIHHASIRARRCGTEGLTHVRPGGGGRVLLIESEVDNLVTELIERARRQTPGNVVERAFRRVE